jgi:phosphohistidine phosphatase
MAMKRLYLLRHAKAAPDDGGGDHERPLAVRGKHDAPAMGQWIAKHGFRPDLVLCSSARRTAETLDLVLPHLVPTPRVQLDPGLYHAPAEAILDRIISSAGTAEAVLVIGHNPGLEDLAADLAGDTKIGRQLAGGLPTCAFAAFESRESDWRAAGAGLWMAEAFLRPADL